MQKDRAPWRAAAIGSWRVLVGLLAGQGVLSLLGDGVAPGDFSVLAAAMVLLTGVAEFLRAKRFPNAPTT